MLLAELIPYAVGAAAWVIAQRFGLKLPLAPAPSPAPAPAVPAADKEAADFLAWALKVKAGYVRLDDHDKETLKLIVSTLKDIPL